MKTKPKTKQAKARSQVDEYGLNVRERKFADMMLMGDVAAGRAYEKAGYTAKGASADTMACLLLKKAKVSDYMKTERRKAAEANQIERWEVVGFLAKVIKTPVGMLQQDSDIAQEWREEMSETGGRTIVKMPDKIAAAKQLCQMLGWNEPEQHKVSFEVVIGGMQDED